MPSIDVRLLFTTLVPQAKTWLIIGIIFSAVAAWLWWVPAHP